MPGALLAASSLVDNQIFVGMVEGFAAMASAIGVLSGFLAFLGLVSGDSNAEIGEAVNVGIAIGFIPGLVMAILVASAAGSTL